MNKKEIYPCNSTNKWMKITKETLFDTPFTTLLKKCSKCKSYAFLNFVHEDFGDYYGVDCHKNCEGKYVFLCSKRKDHIIDIEDDETI